MFREPNMFANREAAGRALARQLSNCGYDKEDPVVLCVARGGIPLGKAIAEEFQCELDICSVGRIASPTDPDFTMAAIGENGEVYLTDRTNWEPMRKYLEEMRIKELADMKQRRLLYNVPAVSLNKRCVIVVDDGIQSGSSVLVALRAIRKCNPSKIVVASPVCSSYAFTKLRAKKALADVVVLNVPRNFMCVAQFYLDFSPVTDINVRDVLSHNREELRSSLSSPTSPMNRDERREIPSLSLSLSAASDDDADPDSLDETLRKLGLDVLPTTPPTSSEQQVAPIVSPKTGPRRLG